MPARPRAFVILAVAAGLSAAASMAGPASARPARARGGPLRVSDCSVRGLAGVPHNAVVAITFSTDVDPASVDPAVFQIRERNSAGTGFTRQVPGAFQVAGSVVRFFPRLPTNLRDPSSAGADFYAPGSPRDSAMDNAGLKGSTDYEVRILGGGAAEVARSVRGRRLAKSYVTRFTTSAIALASEAFSTTTYGDVPPPAAQYSNPADKVASPADQFARYGGTRDVPSAVAVTLFGTRVPLSPSTVRQGGNVSLSMTERGGDTTLAKPIRGTPFVEQNFDGVRLVYKPNFPLPDRGTFALRVTKDVRDLTEQHDFSANAGRLRVREVYDYLTTARALSPGTAPEDLPNPPVESIFDWPVDEAARGVLKRNLLALGDAHPTEIDPRVMILFTTRDEPVSDGSLVFEFDKGDGTFDAVLSTADYGVQVPGAASAILTVAAGSGADGDFVPAQSQTINSDLFPDNTINWRRVTIPQSVKITISGTRAATIKCFDLTLEDGAELLADGRNGADAPNAPTYSQATTTQQAGGAGGPGGGRGGDSASGTNFMGGGDGQPGVDAFGVPLAPESGGRPGTGGPRTATAAARVYGGGGGGGGARLAGENGAPSVNAPTTWTGSSGGIGGAGSNNVELSPLGGGAGGGAGGSGAYPPSGWGVHGGGGGGGGGAILLQTSGTVTIGTNAAIRSRGGAGGKGSVATGTNLESAPGGGGGGGSILLRSSKGFNFANPATAVDVREGARGAAGAGAVYSAPYGGRGGAGYALLQDPTGGTIAQSIPGATGGTYDPVGGGVPSVVYTKWADFGVDGPRLVNFAQKDFTLSAAGNDAILIEIQAAVEDTANFGKPLVAALDAQQNSLDVAQVSPWTPVRILDLTGRPGGAFGPLPGYSVGQQGTDHIFPVTDALNGHNYRFLRLRVRFQCDESQSIHQPFPFVDRVVVGFQFNL